MKIGLVIDDSLDDFNRGVQQYVLTLGKWLNAAGHDVHYLCGQTQRSDLSNLHSLSRNIGVTFNKNRLSVPLPADRRTLQKLLEQEKFDILHVQMPYSPFLAGRLINQAPPPTAIMGTFHIVPFAWFERTLARLLSWWLRPSQRRFGAVISVSEPAQQFALSSFGLKSQIIPNAVELASFKALKPPSQPNKNILKIVFLGRLVPRKGCFELLKSLEMAKSSNWQLIIAGDGPLRSKLRAYCQRSDRLKKTQFRGFVSERQKIDLLNQADLAIFPSLGGESFGIVLIEAMAAGAGVVVGGDNLGYRSILKDWPACLLNVKQLTVMSQQLDALLSDFALRRRIHIEQQAAAPRYDIAQVGPQILETYNQALHSKKRVT